MARTILLIVLAALNAGFAFGMKCNFAQSQNVFQEALASATESCPGLFQSSDKSYCCLRTDGTTYCCDEKEFLVQTGLGIVLPVIVTVVIVVSLIIFCISCLCCSCCPCYRRRHRGTVYGKVQAPIVHVVQTPAPVPQPLVVQSTLYPQSPAGMPQPPPPYTDQAYAKQAPYNPTYVQ